MLFSCFIPFQIVLIPMALVLGKLGLAGTVPGLVLVHVVYGIGFTTLYYRNYYATFPTELVKAAQIDGAGFFRIFWRILLPVSGRSPSSPSSGSSQISGTTSCSASPSAAPASR